MATGNPSQRHRFTVVLARKLRLVVKHSCPINPISLLPKALVRKRQYAALFNNMAFYEENRFII
jgi:hypothetical protein